MWPPSSSPYFCSPDRAVLDLADDHVVALVPRLLLGETERPHVGRTERGPWNVDVLDRVRFEPRRVLDCDHSLVRRLVRERGTVHEVADRVHAVRAGAHCAVDLDQAALLEIHPRGLES